LRRLPPHRQSHDRLFVRVDDEGSAVKDELVLAADLVDVDERNAGFTHARAHQRHAAIDLAALERRAVRDEKQLRPLAGKMTCDSWEPDVLANGNPDTNSFELDDVGQRARLEDALLVE